MLKPPSNADEAMATVRDAIKCIAGRKENANWQHGHVSGMISAFSIVGLFERKHIRTMNLEADEALEKLTHSHFPKEDI